MRKGFGFHDRHSPFRFDPATLFIGGAIEGAFYDSSNITTLFQDDAGTTPVTAVEQTVGRILDLSGNANHATQSVLASRPTYRARYNQLDYSEEFNVSPWQRVGATISADSTTAPDGSTTADTLLETAATSDHFTWQNRASITAAGSYTMSFYAKYNGRFVLAVLSNAVSGDAYVYFDVQNGTITQAATQTGAMWSSTSATITAIGNGWFRCTLTSTKSAAGNVQPQIRASDVGTGSSSRSYAGDITKGIFIWGAQLLPANDVAITGNAYQRVAAATSYDTSSPVWRPYLAFDGSNDSMLTGSIDFTGTDKMTVFAGVTKLSDAAQGVVAELSATIASNNGAFLLSAPNSAAANYNWSSKGTTQVDNTVTTYAAPNTAVLTGQANIAAPSNIIRVNGAQAGSVATTQGTGNFGNYPLYIGRRNNATLPFNGRLYGLIVLGAAASSWQIQVTEQWMAGKTGLQF